MIPVLALIVSVLSLVVGTVVSVLLFRVRSAQDLTNRSEDERNRQVTVATAKLENALANIHELTSKLVDERFRAMTHEINGHVQAFVSTLDMLKLRLADGEEQFTSLGERDQRIELTMAGKFESLKEYIHAHSADRDDLARHQQAVDQKFDKLGEKMERLVGLLAGKGGNARA